jgi:hypothetical protein
MKMAKQKWNPVAKNLHKFHKPKRIEDKRYKKQIKRMEKEIREVKNMQKDIYGKYNVKNVNNIYL